MVRPWRSQASARRRCASGQAGASWTGLGEIGHRVRRPAQLGQRHPGAQPGLRVVGPEAQGGLVFAQRALELAALEEGIAQHDPGKEVAGLHPDRVLQ